jgi:hypothetical protein
MAADGGARFAETSGKGVCQLTQEQDTYGAEPAPEAINPILQFFGYAHLPTPLQDVSKPFHDLAYRMARQLPDNPERAVALRKLLEAKDAAVRAFIYKVPQ